MSELGPSSFERPPRSMDSPGKNADTPFGNHELFGGISEDPAQHDLYDRFGPDYDEGDISYDGLPDYSTDTVYAGLGTEHLDSTSEGVRHSINQIEGIETVIKGNTGLGGQELTDATSEFLAESAIDAVEKHSSDEEEVVGTVLIDGALQATDQRPKASTNPIIGLKKNGLDEQVINGVEKLHKEGATLPDGEPAAEVVAKVVDDYDGKSTAEKPNISEELDLAIQYYTLGASKEDVEKAGIDPSMVTEHLKSLPKEEADFLKEMRQLRKSKNEQEASTPETLKLSIEKINIDTAMQYYVNGASREEFQRAGIDPEVLAKYIRSLPLEVQDHNKSERKKALFTKEAKTKLQESNPELFEGRVGKELESVLHEAGYDTYAVGFNQHDAITDWSEAIEYLKETGGVELGIYNPDERFLLHDKEHPMDDYPMGYYSAQVGRFVYAFPVENTAEDAPRNAVALNRGIPKDTFIDNAEGEQVANARYCVGFIDGDQIFHPYEGFMAKDETTSPYERLTPEQLAKVRDNIADSIVQGIRKYDLAEVTRASANLAAIQREIESRSPETQPVHKRGEVDGAVTYITEPDQTVVQKIVGELRKIDGAPDIARKLYGGVDVPSPNESNPEVGLQSMEMQSLLANISREIRNVTGSEFSESTNPYAAMKNEELTTVVDRLKQTIQERTAQGLDTTDFKNRLKLVGQVINGRK